MSESAQPAQYPAFDLDSPQLTLRAVITACSSAAPCRCATFTRGLKIGWGLNMSITAALLLRFLSNDRKSHGHPQLGMLENNVNQTTASAAASISSAGLVAPIPASGR